MTIVHIDPTRPVAGNFKGTLAGAAATIASGYLLKSGAITKCALFFCEGTAMCAEIEGAIFLLAIAGVGGLVNYAVTHYAQVKKLSELYAMLPTIYREYPQEPKTKSTGASNGNYNK